jgi:hypothetical protein
LRLLTDGRIQNLDQISANTGLSREWIGRILALPPDMFSPRPQLRLVETKKRA